MSETITFEVLVRIARVDAAVIELVAKALGVPQRAVEVIAGATSRRKTLRVTGASLEALEAAIA